MSSAKGEVQMRAAEDEGWTPVRQGAPLHRGATLRTLAGGTALIQSSRGTVLTVPPDSMVTLGTETKDGLHLELGAGRVAVTSAGARAVALASAHEPVLRMGPSQASSHTAEITLEPPPASLIRVEAMTALELACDEQRLTLAAGEVAILREGRLQRRRVQPVFDAFEVEPEPDQLTEAWRSPVFAELSGSVLVRRHNSDVWLPVEPGMRINPLDEVKAAEGARATVLYANGVELDITPGTIVVFREQLADKSGSRRVAELQIGAGRIVSRMTGGTAGAGGEVVLRIMTPSGLVRASSALGPVRVAVGVSNDGTSQVLTEMGRVRIVTRASESEAASGRMLTLDAAGRIVTADPTPAPPAARSRPSKLAAPRLRGPRTQRIKMSEQQVRLEWETDAPAAAYELELARDERFQPLLLKERGSATSFTYENQREPTVYWRVRGVDVRGHNGPFSEPHRLEFVDEDERPTGRFFGESSGEAPSGRGRTRGDPSLQLVVLEPKNAAVLHAPTLEVRGHAAPGALVRVNNVPADTRDDGGFTAEIELQEGVNQVVVEARDAQGRLAHDTRSVFFKK